MMIVRWSLVVELIGGGSYWWRWLVVEVVSGGDCVVEAGSRDGWCLVVMAGCGWLTAVVVGGGSGRQQRR